MLVCALFVHIAHETAGAARTRHSLRPCFERREDTCKPRAHGVARIIFVVPALSRDSYSAACVAEKERQRDRAKQMPPVAMGPGSRPGRREGRNDGAANPPPKHNSPTAPPPCSRATDC